jgi:hypothetical protein
MSNQFHHKLRYAHYFMAPVWIALALGGMGVAFLLGGALVTDEWSRQDNEKLASYKPGGIFTDLQERPETRVSLPAPASPSLSLKALSPAAAPERLRP